MFFFRNLLYFNFQQCNFGPRKLENFGYHGTKIFLAVLWHYFFQLSGNAFAFRLSEYPSLLHAVDENYNGNFDLLIVFKSSSTKFKARKQSIFIFNDFFMIKPSWKISKNKRCQFFFLRRKTSQNSAITPKSQVTQFNSLKIVKKYMEI